MYEYNAELDRVVDGDTIDCRIDLGFGVWIKQRVRLYGINAPESRTRNKEEKKRGLAAKEWLIEKLKNAGNKFEIRTHLDKKGKYGRVLGEIFVWITEEGKDPIRLNINERMIEEGHALKYLIKR